MSNSKELPAAALSVAWFGRKYGKVQVIKDNSKERHPVPVHEPDSDDEDVAVEFPDSDDDPRSEDELFMYAQTSHDGRAHVSCTATAAQAGAAYKQLCYYVQTSGPQPLLRWVPATAVRAAAGSQLARPGFRHAPSVVSYYVTSPQRQVLLKTVEMDPLLPFKVEPNTRCKEPASANKSTAVEGPSSWFIEHGKRLLCENFNKALENDCRLLNSRATLESLLHDTREKQPLTVADVVSEADVEQYLQLWKSQFTKSQAPPPRCAACAGGAGRLRACPSCRVVYHLPCRKQWLTRIIQGAAGPGAEPAPPPRELRDVLPCPRCVWQHRPSEQRWYLKVWPVSSEAAAAPDAPTRG